VGDAIAHSADALDDLARCAEMTAADLAELLDAVYSVICVEDETYTCLEEERVSTAVIAVLKTQKLPDAEVERWIIGFGERALNVTAMPAKLILRANVKDFLQSLYFRVSGSRTLLASPPPLTWCCATSTCSQNTMRVKDSYRTVIKNLNLTNFTYLLLLF
jgi:hypothetical protein